MNRILVLGCGGVGGVIAAKLVRAGYDVTSVTKNPEIADAVAADRLTAIWRGKRYAVPLHAVAALDDDAGIFDMAVLAVPPAAAERALEHALPYLSPSAPVLCCPNGLVEERLLETIDVSRVVGSIVTFPATMEAPGRVRQMGSGGFTIGQLPGASRDLDDIAAVLQHVGPVQRTDNLSGARWSKLAINCAFSGLGTIAGTRLGLVLRGRQNRRLVLETMTEAIRVARAEGVVLAKLSGAVDLNKFVLPEEGDASRLSLVAGHTVLLAVAAKHRKMRSSLLRAIERGRDPGIDFLNGEVCERSERHGIATPVNAAIVDKVRAIARGEIEPSLAQLGSLFEETRGSNATEGTP